jgi:arginyl-tRNA--protein-N-Asp/Glu arginylyltransferase
METRWEILQLKRIADTGLVIQVVYEVTGIQYQLFAKYKQTITLDGDINSPSFVPFEELTKDIVLEWVKDSVNIGDIENTLQESLNIKLANKQAQTTVIGTPWDKKIF